MTESIRNQEDKRINNEAAITIDLAEVFQSILKYWWAVALSVAVFAVAFFCYAKVCITPMYSSSLEVYVNNSTVGVGSKSISISMSDLNASSGLIDLYKGILENQTTYDLIIADCGLSDSWKSVSNMVETSQVNDTSIMKITVTCDDPEKACLIANSIGKVLPERIAEVVDGSTMVIVDKARVSESPVSPSVKKYMLIGILAGLVLSCGVIFMTVVFDNTIHDEDYLSNTYGVPVLASIPDLEEISSEKYYKKAKNAAKYYKSSSYSYSKGVSARTGKIYSENDESNKEADK